jgi:acetyl esterase/lipase
MAGDDFAGDCVVSEGSALVDALVSYEGPFDRSTHNYRPGVDLVALREEDPDVWEATNPFLLIGGNPDLVVRLIHGDDNDDAWYEVPRAVSVEFHQALVEAGYEAELILLEGANHTALRREGTEAFAETVQQVMQIAGG